MVQTFLSEFIQQSIIRLEENTPKIKKCLDELTEEEVWQRPNASSNSVGNLILHLCGNMTQYILSGLGKVEDNRQREKEFTTVGGQTKKELLDKLQSTVTKAVSVIRDLPVEECLNKRSVQAYELSAIGIVIHVVEHYSYHTGQIIFWTKLIKDKDLAFYSTAKLNKKNII
jgi:uncharacterized damage-inducible protein DinB